MFYRTIFENDDYIGIEKIYPIPCIRLNEKAGLSDELILEYPYLSKIKDYGFCHRIDNETLGLILIAKRQDVYEKTRAMFTKNLINKTYYARVDGIMINDEGKIYDSIAHDKKNDKKMVVLKQGYKVFRGKKQEAKTFFKVLKRNKTSTDLKVCIKTGVRHQIRVHLKSIGHSIIEDSLYGQTLGNYPSMMLISKKISFVSPIDSEKINILSTISLDNMFKNIR
jgi:23S rRNA pseudouridine1911/1915/1917 synthase